MTKAEAHYVRIAPNEPLPEVAALSPFKAVIVLNARYSETWQGEVSDWLVANGCRYMMAWGPDSTTWDDSVDFADLEARNFEDDDARFVMTTWHDNESLESTFWFSQFCANFTYDDVELRSTLIVDVSQIDREEELLALFFQAKTLAEREPG